MCRYQVPGVPYATLLPSPTPRGRRGNSGRKSRESLGKIENNSKKFTQEGKKKAKRAMETPHTGIYDPELHERKMINLKSLGK
jgi:hypothetical protein